MGQRASSALRACAKSMLRCPCTTTRAGDTVFRTQLVLSKMLRKGRLQKGRFADRSRKTSGRAAKQMRLLHGGEGRCND